MGKYRFTFTNILFWVAIIASILVFENITFFEKGTAETFMLPGMQDPYFFMFFGIAAFCFVALILYETFFNRAKVNKLALVVCLTVLVCGIIGIYSFNGMTFSNGAAPIVVTEWDKIKHVLSFVLFVLTVYSTVFYFNKNHPSIKRLRFLFLILVLVTYFFVIYSIATEYWKYEMIANTKLDEEIPHVSVQSLFQNSNMFAGFILMGICAAMGLNYFKKNPLSYISIIGFSIVQVFACSLTSIIITITGTLLYFLAEIIADFKKYKTGPVPFVKLTIVLIAYVAIILMFCLAQTYDVGAVTAFCRYLYRELSTSDFNSFTNRREIWEAAIGASNQNITTLLFGYGFRNSEYIVGGLMNVDDHRISCHNGYLQLLLNFGVIGLVAFGVFVFVYLFSLIRLFRRHLRFSLIFLIIGFSYFALATMESIIAFNASATGIIIGASFYLPVINRYRHFRHKEVGDYAKLAKANGKTITAEVYKTYDRATGSHKKVKVTDSLNTYGLTLKMGAEATAGTANTRTLSSSDHSNIEISLYENGTLIQSEIVDYLETGEGKQGIQGCVLRNCGAYKNDVTYINEAYVIPQTADYIRYIDYVVYPDPTNVNDSYYYMVAPLTTGTGRRAVRNVLPTDTINWIKATQMDFAYIKNLIADYISAQTIVTDELLIKRED